MDIFRIIQEIRNLPHVNLYLWGNHSAFTCYQSFTRQHPRYKIIPNKKYGVALLPLPETFDQYISGKPRQALRTNRKHALQAGYTFSAFASAEHLTTIHKINLSSPTRQGRVMESDYLDLDAVARFADEHPCLYGVFRPNGDLCAYTHVPTFGEISIFSRLLGHAEDLEQGIMYLLISEVIREKITARQQEGVPCWMMYDTFFGASAGLRFFKERLGFQPYIVNWHWAKK